MKRHILIVEDNPLNSELLRDWLEIEGYLTDIAPNLDAGFAALKRQQPDVVLLDVQLGEEDGLSLSAWMHRQPALKDIPVIAVPPQVMISDRQRILESGCHNILPMPVEYKVLRRQQRLWLGWDA